MNQIMCYWLGPVLVCAACLGFGYVLGRAHNWAKMRTLAAAIQRLDHEMRATLHEHSHLREQVAGLINGTLQRKQGAR